MGIIQGAINRMLGTAGLASSLISKTIKAEERQVAAMKKVENTTTAKQNQKRNFMNYLKTMPISGGGVVGCLPKEAQKTIAKQYSQAQRKQIMDTADATKKRG